MPIALILIGSIGWSANIIIAYQSANTMDVSGVNGHTSTALVFLWVLFGGLLWQWSRK